MRQFAVIGMGRFGASVAKTLGSKGHQVLGVDISQELLQEADEYCTTTVQLDATDEKALKSVGADQVDVAIVSVGDNLEASILITLNLQELGVREIVSKAVSVDHGKVLAKVGATKVVFPERDMGELIANTLVTPGIVEYLDISQDYSILEMVVPKPFIGKSIKDADIRAKYGLNVIAIKHVKKTLDKRGEEVAQEQVNMSPNATDVLRESDVLIIIGSNENIERFKQRKPD